ncbi:hypothetical protein [Candidatus Methylocalor cossyra]|uniref:Lipoprotein n=1 Tax=Candidatus Methylocalor cossyra TaxID=3108543 RepID=A0ABM9NKL6_9GAMM
MATRPIPSMLAAAIALAGCSETLVKDQPHPETGTTLRCSGSAWVDDSAFSTVPIPVLAFFFPKETSSASSEALRLSFRSSGVFFSHGESHGIQAEDYLKRCGSTAELINRQVTVHRDACIPAALTWLATLGVWQWCPAQVVWQADLPTQRPSAAE